MECKFESSVRMIDAPQQVVYDNLSDLTNLERIKDRMPEDKIQEFTFDRDSLSVSVSPVGTITLRIIEREEPKCLKFETEESPIPFFFWIQLLPVTEETSKMKLTIKTDLNPLMKGMVKKPLTDAIEKMADVLASVKYEPVEKKDEE